MLKSNILVLVIALILLQVTLATPEPNTVGFEIG